jgi:hypothetical protein
MCCPSIFQVLHCPRVSHAQAVKRICRYLLGTKDKGLIFDPKEDFFDCWVDASHATEWSSSSAMNDPNTARSRIGYKICYAGCPMIWASKMQTEIALSSTEALQDSSVVIVTCFFTVIL